MDLCGLCAFAVPKLLKPAENSVTVDHRNRPPFRPILILDSRYSICPTIHPSGRRLYGYSATRHKLLKTPTLSPVGQP
jgi:hypothetical protein